MARKTYKSDVYNSGWKDPGKDTGSESMTEQEYLPVAVQVNRFFAAGERMAEYKRELYDIGWDEDFNINTVKPSPENMDRIDAQEELEGAIDRIKEAQSSSRMEPDVTEPQEDQTSNETADNQTDTEGDTKSVT